MFGLSSREVLIKAIKNACQNEAGVYRDGIKSFLSELSDNDISDEEMNSRASSARNDYLNAVFDVMLSSFRVSSPVIEQRIRLAISCPQITGLPGDFNVEYFANSGISAGCAYAMCYFATTNKEITARDFKDCSMLNHYQNAIMDSILAGSITDK